MSNPTDINEYRKRLTNGDVSPKHRYTDENGVEWYEYLVDYTDSRGVDMGIRIWATSFDDADARFRAIAETGRVVGVLCEEVPL